MNQAFENVDQRELSKFDALASRWWDPNSEFKPLHDINPLRLTYITSKIDLTGKRVVDVGCGGGILAESMALRGASVTGIDMAESSLSVARLHLAESGAEVDYHCMTAEQLSGQESGHYDVVTCMELLEHVPNPASLVRACAALVKPDGHVFFSTINRNPKAYLFAIIGAEYLLRLLPKGTHDYARFIRPSELAGWIRDGNLSLHHITGMTYNPVTKQYALGRDIDVNYMVHATSDCQ